jgi:hypothetical protein
MKNITRHNGKLEVLKRLPSSGWGNPRFKLRIDGFTCTTTVDSSHGYEVQNYDGIEVVATIGTHYGIAQLNTIKRA